MKKIIQYVGMIAVLLGFCTCSDLMDKGPLDKISETAIWNDLNLAEAFINNQYKVLPNVYSGDFCRSHRLSFFTDEATDKYMGSGTADYYRGGMSPSNLTSLNSWKYHYDYIRGCNIFLKNADDLPATTDADKKKKDRMKGEALTLRAWSYLDLAARYGGVVKITEPFELSDDFIHPRSSFEEIMELIIEDLDAAIGLLPEEYDSKDWGRLTKGAAMGLKSRALLYAASPLFNKTNDKAKWEAAAKATKDVIDYAERTQLYDLVGDKDTYSDIFRTWPNKEMMITMINYPKYGSWYFSYPDGVGGGVDGNGTHDGWSTTMISQKMVDAFEMIDGTPFDWSNPVHAANPYANRDPRLDVDVTHDGSMWVYEDTFVEFWICEKSNNFNLPQYKDNVYPAITPGFEMDDKVYGKNSLGNKAQVGNMPEVGYIYRKALDVYFEDAYASEPYITAWIVMRYSEILLNYAEALFETGNEAQAKIYLNKIRNRVSMPPVTATGNELRKKIQHERWIELCFEAHRYFDARRWLIAEKEFSDPFYGISIVKDKNSDKKVYTPFKFQDRSFPKQYYLQPIPLDEIQKSGITQNEGYN